MLMCKCGLWTADCSPMGWPGKEAVGLYPLELMEDSTKMQKALKSHYSFQKFSATICLPTSLRPVFFGFFAKTKILFMYFEHKLVF
uniref:Uncharacterized protein n=1 Tax=Anguilla anguilla TaxID=7936 RepID=A0A0E9WWR2_ANGAN